MPQRPGSRAKRYGPFELVVRRYRLKAHAGIHSYPDSALGRARRANSLWLDFKSSRAVPFPITASSTRSTSRTPTSDRQPLGTVSVLKLVRRRLIARALIPLYLASTGAYQCWCVLTNSRLTVLEPLGSEVFQWLANDLAAAFCLRKHATL